MTVWAWLADDGSVELTVASCELCVWNDPLADTDTQQLLLTNRRTTFCPLTGSPATSGQLSYQQ